MTMQSFIISIAAGLFIFFAAAAAHYYGECNELKYVIHKMKMDAEQKQADDEQRHQAQLARRRERRRSKKNGNATGE